MIETDLSMKDFTEYFEQKRLGKLYFPNGRPVYCDDVWQSFHVHLSDLYKLITGWKINSTEMSPNDIFAVIASGSAIRFKEEIKKRKKYFLAGPEIVIRKQINFFPDDVNFYVLINKDLDKKASIPPLYEHPASSPSYVTEVGINVFQLGINQLLNKFKEEDKISIDVLKEGVPIFFNEKLEDVIIKSEIKKETPRKVYWDEDRNGYLIGEIK